MGLFDWFTKKKQPDQLADIVRQPVDPEFAAIWAEYDARSASEVLTLCLEGGGAKGRWQGGFLARAAELGLLSRVQAIAGTSVGGLNACVTSRYMDESPNLQAVVDIWRGIRTNADIYLGEMPHDFMSAAKALLTGKLTGESVLDVAPLRALVKKHLGGITSFRVPTFTVTTDYVSKSIRLLGPGTLAEDMALATSAVPGAFPAHQGQFMDGGCVMNCPYPFLLGSQKATKIVVLYCDPDPATIPVHADKPSTINTGTAAIASLFSVQSNMAFEALEMTAELRKLRGESAIEIAHFYPSVPTGTLLEFGDHPELLQKGYDDAVLYFTPQKLRDLLVA
jgi:predicted acylesterase/phospholipase RssA